MLRRGRGEGAGGGTKGGGQGRYHVQRKGAGDQGRCHVLGKGGWFLRIPGHNCGVRQLILATTLSSISHLPPPHLTPLPPAHVQARYGMSRLMLAATALGCSSARQATTSAMCLHVGGGG